MYFDSGGFHVDFVVIFGLIRFSRRLAGQCVVNVVRFLSGRVLGDSRR